MEAKTRRPLIAAMLSLVTPGLGQMYNGQIRKGIAFYLVLSLFEILLLWAKLQYTFIGMLVVFSALITPYIINAWEAFVTARKLKIITLKPYNKWYFYILLIVLPFALEWVIEGGIKAGLESWGLKAYKIASGGMEPAMSVGDRIIVDIKSYAYHNPQRGDIVVFKYPLDPSRDWIKRIVATENDVIEIQDKIIYINGTPITEPYVQQVDNESKPRGKDKRDNCGPLTIPKNKVFVMGDNRNRSLDSRHFGYLDKNQIRGKALYFYWSKQKNRIGKEIK